MFKIEKIRLYASPVEGGRYWVREIASEISRHEFVDSVEVKRKRHGKNVYPIDVSLQNAGVHDVLGIMRQYEEIRDYQVQDNETRDRDLVLRIDPEFSNDVIVELARHGKLTDLRKTRDDARQSVVRALYKDCTGSDFYTALLKLVETGKIYGYKSFSEQNPDCEVDLDLGSSGRNLSEESFIRYKLGNEGRMISLDERDIYELPGLLAKVCKERADKPTLFINEPLLSEDYELDTIDPGEYKSIADDILSKIVAKESRIKSKKMKGRKEGLKNKQKSIERAVKKMKKDKIE